MSVAKPAFIKASHGSQFSQRCVLRRSDALSAKVAGRSLKFLMQKNKNNYRWSWFVGIALLATTISLRAYPLPYDSAVKVSATVSASSSEHRPAPWS